MAARRRRPNCPRRLTLDEAMEERAAIIAEGCGVTQSMGLARAQELVRRYCKPRDEAFNAPVDTESARWKHAQRQLPVDNLPDELDFG